MQPAEFVPARWLSNPHVQSLLASARFRRALIDAAALESASEARILDCGAGVRLLAQHARQPEPTGDTPVVVMIHGWEGSADSSYLVSAAASLYRDGAEVVRLNLRDHGDTHHLNEEIFHSCRLDEAVAAVAAIARETAPRPLYLVGWSLGGNFAVRIAHRAPETGIELAHTVAVSPVVVPAHSYSAMQHGPFFYRRYFLHKWRRSLSLKQRAFPGRFDFSEVVRMTDLREMTARLVDMFGEFATVDEYFDGYALHRDMLEGARSPLTVVTAKDDPVIPVADFAPFRSGGKFGLLVADRGGHCGFMPRIGAHGWIDDLLRRTVV